MVSPTEIIKDIQDKLDRVVRDYQQLLVQNIKLETENKSLATSLEEAIKQQESFKHQLDIKRQDIMRESKGLDQWKIETRKEVRSLLKEVEKCIPQVEAMLENK